MLRALVVDDEAPARERLKKLLTPYTDLEVVAEAADGISALEEIAKQPVDLVFLDIEMPELSGMEVARTIGLDGPRIIFVTAYDEHALEAFEAHAVDYLVKPIRMERLKKTLDKIKSLERVAALNVEALTRSAKELRRLAVKIGPRYEVFDATKVSAVLASDHYAKIIVEQREIYSEDSLDAVGQRLDDENFMRVHRNAVINLRFLKELRRDGDRKYMAVLDDLQKTQIPVSRERLRELKAALGLK